MPRKPGVPGYENLTAKAERGEYTLIDPLDYLILQHLNDEGTTFANVYPLGHTTKQVNKEKFDGQLPATVLTPRFGTLHAQGLIVPMKTVGAGGGNVWQRTARGTKVLREWEAKRGSSDGSEA